MSCAAGAPRGTNEPSDPRIDTRDAGADVEADATADGSADASAGAFVEPSYASETFEASTTRVPDRLPPARPGPPPKGNPKMECAQPLGNGCCGDVVLPPEIRGGRYVCPAKWVPIAKCRGRGRECH